MRGRAVKPDSFVIEVIQLDRRAVPGAHGEMNPIDWFQSESKGDVFQETAALAVVLTLIVRLIWSATSYLTLRFREFLDSPVRLCTVVLSSWNGVLGEARLRCLVVRFGTDPYLMHLASEQEKFEGRLRNRIVEVETKELVTMLGLRRDLMGTFKLPVHRRLGTQFKLFFEAPTLAIAERIAKSDAFAEASIDKSSRPFRVWVVASQFGRTTSVEGYTNNFWPAI